MRNCRHDLDPTSARTYAADIAKIKAAAFADLEATAITPALVTEWIAELLKPNLETGRSLKPPTIRRYVGTLRQVLDHAGLEPNSARHRTFKLPKKVREEPNPPTAAHVLAMFERVAGRMLLPLITLEQIGARVGEAASLGWGDVDVAGNRFRLRAEDQDRPCPLGAGARLADGRDRGDLPTEDRAEARPVFGGFTESRAWKALDGACKAAGIPHYHPHDLRHRRLSLWHGGGVTARELADRAGHAKPSESLDTYSHVMPLDEVPIEAFRALLARPGVAQVRPGDHSAQAASTPIALGEAKKDGFEPSKEVITPNVGPDHDRAVLLEHQEADALGQLRCEAPRALANPGAAGLSSKPPVARRSSRRPVEGASTSR